MRIYVLSTLATIKSGVEARSPELRITSHGRDGKQALESLRRGVSAWCEGLRRAGGLQEALERRGVRYDQEGEDVDVLVAPPEGDIL
jgi:hypothetical protein